MYRRVMDIMDETARWIRGDLKGKVPAVRGEHGDYVCSDVLRQSREEGLGGESRGESLNRLRIRTARTVRGGVEMKLTKGLEPLGSLP